MVRKLLLICIILAQFVRIAAFAAAAGDFSAGDGTSSTCASLPVSKIVGNSLIYQLELLTKIASLACTISQNKTPAPAKTPAPVSRTSNEIIAPQSGPAISKQLTAQPQAALLQLHLLSAQSSSPGMSLKDPPGQERTTQRLFAQARGGLEAAASAIFSYGINNNPQSQNDWGFFNDGIIS